MEFQESKPIYLQIADKIMDDILAGVYPPEGRLPSMREYAAGIEVNVNTVLRTYDYLQQQDVIFNRRGLGYFVAQEASKTILSLRRSTFMTGELPYFFRRLKSLGIDVNELASLYTDFINSHS